MVKIKEEGWGMEISEGWVQYGGWGCLIPGAKILCNNKVDICLTWSIRSM